MIVALAGAFFAPYSKRFSLLSDIVEFACAIFGIMLVAGMA
jgi:hypothetical protein